MEYHTSGFGSRHFQMILITLAFFKNEWVVTTVAISTDGVHSSGFRSVHEQITNQKASNNWFVAPTLFTARLLAAVAPLYLSSKYIILISSVIQGASLIALPMLKQSHNLDLLKFTYINIEIMTIFQLPAAYTLLARWTPHHEFGKNISLLSTGSYAAFFIFVQLEALFPFDSNFTYYFGGVLVLIWSGVWLVFCAPDPHKCFYISKAEKLYLSHHLPLIRKVAFNVAVPFRKILSCLPIYGFLLADISVEVYKITGRHHKLTSVFFINTIHLQNSEAPSTIATMLITNCMALLLFGLITDKLISKGFSLNNIRKTVSSIALWGSSICLAFLGYSTQYWNIHLFYNLSIYLRTLSIVGHLLVPFDIAQNYGGFIVGLSKAITTLLFPILNKLEKEIIRQAILKKVWDYYWYFTGAGNFFANSIFLMCGTIYKRDFDSVGTFNWRQQSIHSYP